MRDDFGIEKIEPIKVALTAEQVADYELPPEMKAKEGSVNYDRFVVEHGENVFELEAIDSEDLQLILTEAIDSVIDVDAFNEEIDREKEDAAFLQNIRLRITEYLEAEFEAILDEEVEDDE